jgi:hypothetical protein
MIPQPLNPFLFDFVAPVFNPAEVEGYLFFVKFLRARRPAQLKRNISARAAQARKADPT